MNSTRFRFRISALIFSLSAAMFFISCASTDSKKESESKAEKDAKAVTAPPLPAGVTLKKEKDLNGVWLAPGFNFTGAPDLKIEPTVYNAIERPNEAEMRKFA